MKKILWLILPIIVLACNQFVPPPLAPTPNDFPPPPPMTPILEFPQVTVTTTIEPRTRPVLPDDIADAETFFLILKTSIAAGDDVGVAKVVKYPIYININGQDLLINNQSEFVDAYDQIFDPEFAAAIFDMDEAELSLQPNGVKTVNGELWFNYYCVDLACSDSQFLITQINK